MTDSLSAVIDAAFERRTEFSPQSAPAEVRDAVEQAIALLDAGKRSTRRCSSSIRARPASPRSATVSGTSTSG